MHILFLSRWYPYPANNGSKIRVYNLIKELARHHEVTLISFATEPVSAADLAGMRQLCAEVHTVPYRAFQPSGRRALLGLFGRRPRSVMDTYSPTLSGLIHAAARRRQFDITIASQIDMALYPLELPETPRVLEEIEVSIFLEQARRERHPLRKLRKHLMARKWSAYLAEVLRQYQGATVVSEPEIAPIHAALPGFAPLAVIPNGADVVRFTGDFGQPEPDTIVYTGALTYHVNLDAMRFFLGEVFPRVQAAHPAARLKIAGRTEGVPIETLPQLPGVEFTGHTDDIRPLIAQSWVSIVPERFGGGTRIKVPEALALGTPVVSTTRGATGLALTPGFDVLVADQAADFAAAVVRVLRDQPLRNALSRNGRATVERLYDWRVIGAQFDAFLQDLVPTTTTR
jgi:polysaccharide biosynthesis protein PslH